MTPVVLSVLEVECCSGYPANDFGVGSSDVILVEVAENRERQEARKRHPPT